MVARAIQVTMRAYQTMLFREWLRCRKWRLLITREKLKETERLERYCFIHTFAAEGSGSICVYIYCMAWMFLYSSRLVKIIQVSCVACETTPAWSNIWERRFEQCPTVNNRRQQSRLWTNQAPVVRQARLLSRGTLTWNIIMTLTIRSQHDSLFIRRARRSAICLASCRLH